jgi:hypothetical protein
MLFGVGTRASQQSKQEEGKQEAIRNTQNPNKEKRKYGSTKS